ncbi:hypothetical protein DFS34DRAFT_682432 [Phlyctochytrium arcticum]|nr:hypothetical protein DFS34DRAFT_682432 [Phlyctochytrium arcticum]
MLSETYAPDGPHIQQFPVDQFQFHAPAPESTPSLHSYLDCHTPSFAHENVEQLLTEEEIHFLSKGHHQEERTSSQQQFLQETHYEYANLTDQSFGVSQHGSDFGGEYGDGGSNGTHNVNHSDNHMGFSYHQPSAFTSTPVNFENTSSAINLSSAAMSTVGWDLPIDNLQSATSNLSLDDIQLVSTSGQPHPAITSSLLPSNGSHGRTRSISMSAAEYSSDRLQLTASYDMTSGTDLLPQQCLYQDQPYQYLPPHSQSFHLPPQRSHLNQFRQDNLISLNYLAAAESGYHQQQQDLMMTGMNGMPYSQPLGLHSNVTMTSQDDLGYSRPSPSWVSKGFSRRPRASTMPTSTTGPPSMFDIMNAGTQAGTESRSSSAKIQAPIIVRCMSSSASPTPRRKQLLMSMSGGGIGSPKHSPYPSLSMRSSSSRGGAMVGSMHQKCSTLLSPASLSGAPSGRDSPDDTSAAGNPSIPLLASTGNIIYNGGKLQTRDPLKMAKMASSSISHLLPSPAASRVDSAILSGGSSLTSKPQPIALIPIAPAPARKDPVPLSQEEHYAKLDTSLLRADFDDITVAELKDLLRERGLPSSGKKALLVQRLQEELQLIHRRKDGQLKPEDDPRHPFYHQVRQMVQLREMQLTQQRMNGLDLPGLMGLGGMLGGELSNPSSFGFGPTSGNYENLSSASSASTSTASTQAFLPRFLMNLQGDALTPLPNSLTSTLSSAAIQKFPNIAPDRPGGGVRPRSNSDSRLLRPKSYTLLPASTLNPSTPPADSANSTLPSSGTNFGESSSCDSN